MHSARVGSSVKQSTRLNLGSHFDLPSTRARRAGPRAAELPLPGARAKRPRWTASTRKSGRNRYSVPCELHGQVVSTRLYPASVVVVADDRIVARHDRLSNAGETR